MGQHRNDLKYTNKPGGTTAVVTHFEEEGHIPALHKASIVDHERHLGKRLILESLHIMNNVCYNRRQDTDGISSSYCAPLQMQNMLSAYRTISIVEDVIQLT